MFLWSGCCPYHCQVDSLGWHWARNLCSSCHLLTLQSFLGAASSHLCFCCCFRILCTAFYRSIAPWDLQKVIPSFLHPPILFSCHIQSIPVIHLLFLFFQVSPVLFLTSSLGFKKKFMLLSSCQTEFCSRHTKFKTIILSSATGFWGFGVLGFAVPTQTYV